VRLLTKCPSTGALILTLMAEIAELQMPGGRERVVARMRQEQAGGAVRDDAFDFAVPNVPMPPRRPPGL
jgi:hypothetical protein